jgi:hypothetical protein
MQRVVRHVLLPAVAPAAIVALYLTPAPVIGCATRGLLALAVTLSSAAGAFGAVGLAFRGRRDPAASWWVLSAAVLMAPLGLLLGPLG